MIGGGLIMVLKMAIVDDDTLFLQDIEKISYEFLKKEKVIASIDTFTSHRMLLYEVDEDSYYDLFLLDIEMKDDNDINGIQIAKRIREYNRDSIIIFVTSHMKYTLDAFKVIAFRYIPKNELKKGLEEALQETIKELHEREKSFYLIETITKYIKLYYTNIYYIYKVGKYSIFVSTTGEYKVRKSLATVFKELNSLEFVFVERGFIANITHIDRMEDEKVFMDNGIVLKVSRPQIHMVKEKIAEYWGENT